MPVSETTGYKIDCSAVINLHMGYEVVFIR